MRETVLAGKIDEAGVVNRSQKFRASFTDDDRRMRYDLNQTRRENSKSLKEEKVNRSQNFRTSFTDPNQPRS